MLTQLRNLKEARGLPKHIRTNSEETSDLLHFYWTHELYEPRPKIQERSWESII